MSKKPPGTAGGSLLASARNSAVTLLGTGRTRLALLGNELKEEKQRAIHLLLLSQLLAFCVALAVILLVAVLVVTFWEQRIIVLASATALFIAASGVAYAALQRAMQRPDRAFAASLAELSEDLHQLKRAAADESGAD